MDNGDLAFQSGRVVHVSYMRVLVLAGWASQRGGRTILGRGSLGEASRRQRPCRKQSVLGRP